MNTISKFLAAPLCAIALFASPLASASLVAQDSGSFRDTDTGYLWRTLGQYQGLDYASAVKALPAGYHVASEKELATLTRDIGADPGTFYQDAAAMNVAIDPGYPIIWGFYGDGSRYAWKTDWDTTWTSSTANASGWANADTGAVPAGFSDPNLSIFAVDTGGAGANVPEPATPALVGFGLAGLALRRRALKR